MAKKRKKRATRVRHKGIAKYRAKHPRKNPNATVRGWVKARAVKIERNKRGQAVSVKIKT